MPARPKLGQMIAAVVTAGGGDLLTGLALSNNGTDATNDIDIAVGATDSDDAAIANRVRMSLTTAITKQLDAAWAVGTNAGGLDTGAIANNTYHVFLIQRTDTGVVDALFSLSATAPTMPASYTKQRRIGSILREAAAIVAFDQYGDEFWRDAGVLDVDATNPGTAAVTRTLSVPTGVKMQAIVNAMVLNASNADVTLYLSSLDATDAAPSTTAAPLATVGATVNNASAHLGGQARIWTNTSAQIRSRLGGTSGASDIIRVATLGWLDRRGRG